MAVSSLHQQLCGSTDNIRPDGPTGVYNYIVPASPFDEYEACLEVGNICPQEDSFDSSEAAAGADVELQHCATSPPVIYPWMKQRRQHRNGTPSVSHH